MLNASRLFLSTLEMQSKRKSLEEKITLEGKHNL
jgi:hypothetical protein